MRFCRLSTELVADGALCLHHIVRTNAGTYFARYEAIVQPSSDDDAGAPTAMTLHPSLMFEDC